MQYIHLFLSLVKCGLLAFGGGAAMVPMIEHEVVHVLAIMTCEEFSNAYAIGNSLPGPITTKLAALVGYKMGGYLGSLLAVTAILLPSSILMLTIYALYSNNSDKARVKGIVNCIKPVILVMIMRLFLSTSQNMVTGIGTNSILICTLIVISSCGILLFKLPPSLFIVIACLSGFFFYH